METITLGKSILQQRKKKGLTQEALANLLGVTNQAVSKWEADQCCPDVQLLPALADIFEISLDELFGRCCFTTQTVVSDLPWEDDHELRAVLYLGQRLQQHQLLDRYQKEKRLLEFHYSGPALNVNSDFAVVCENCLIQGSVIAGDGVVCEDIRGNVTAGDGVKCGNVGGSVTAGDGITCGNIQGNARAGDSIRCAQIGGKASARDGIYYQK